MLSPLELELELQVVVSRPMWVLDLKLWDSEEQQLLTVEPSHWSVCQFCKDHFNCAERQPNEECSTVSGSCLKGSERLFPWSRVSYSPDNLLRSVSNHGHHG